MRVGLWALFKWQCYIASVPFRFQQKVFIAVFALVAVVSADVSHLARQRSSGPDAEAQILRQDADVNVESYNYAYETSNGIAAQEAGQLKNAGRVSIWLIWKICTQSYCVYAIIINFNVFIFLLISYYFKECITRGSCFLHQLIRNLV